MELMYITNSPQEALGAEEAGVDIIFIDLESIGKKERQGHLNTYISNHSFDDIKLVSSVLKSSKLLVRINPLHKASKEEIDKSIDDGADILMLPMSTNRQEVENFVSFVNKRAETCLLLETPQAMVRLDDILEVEGIDRVHIGLNDLHLGLGLNFMFELLTEGIIDYLAGKILEKNIAFGFGGIARIGEGIIPAEMILKEHFRLGSTRVILSRTFRDTIMLNDLNKEVAKIRLAEKDAANTSKEGLDNNRMFLQKRVREYVKEKNKKES